MVDMEMELLKQALHSFFEALIEWFNWSGPVGVYIILLAGFAVIMYSAVRLMDYYLPNDLLEEESSRLIICEPFEVLFDYVHCPVAFEVKESSTQIPDTLSFQLTLEPDHNNQEDTLNDVIYSEFKCKIFWGIHVSSLTKLIYSDLTDFYKKVEGSTEDLDSLGISHLSLSNLNTPLGERIRIRTSLEVKLPENVKWEHMANTYRYPVCFLIYRAADVTHSQLPIQRTRRSMSCLFVILHLKNQLVDIPTTVLGRFMKLSDNTTYPVKEMYLSDVKNEDSDEEGEPEEAEQTPASNEPVDNALPPHRRHNALFPGVTCTVCRTLAATITILPCGHLCVCGICLTKLLEPFCPICRGWIHSFFQAY